MTESLNETQTGISLVEDLPLNNQHVQNEEIKVLKYYIDKSELKPVNQTIVSNFDLHTTNNSNTTRVLTYHKLAQVTPEGITHDSVLPTTSQVVIVTPDLNYRPITELVLVHPTDTQVSQPSVVTDLSETKFTLEVATQEKTNFVEPPSEARKDKIKNKIQEKLLKIWNLIPKSELLTPRQYECVSSKLNNVLDIYNSLNDKNKTKKTARKKNKTLKRDDREEETEEQDVQSNVNNELSNVNVSLGQPLYETQLYTYLGEYG